MATKIIDRLTPITPQQFLEALGYCWVELLNTPPEKNSLLVLMAQSALETGRWKYAHNYNIGNAKRTEGDGRDYTYFACNEILDSGVAAAYEAKSTPDRPAKIINRKQNGTAEIWFYPEHPGCCFRAYQVMEEDGSIDEHASLVAGMTDYLGLLYRRFSRAWPAVLAGDPDLFCTELKNQRYFTADLEQYKRSVKSLFYEYLRAELDFSAIPLVSEAQKKKLLNLSAAVLQESIRDMIEEADTDRPPSSS